MDVAEMGGGGDGGGGDDDSSVVSDPAPSPLEDTSRGTIKAPAVNWNSSSKIGGTTAGQSAAHPMHKSATDVRSTGSNPTSGDGSSGAGVSNCAIICLLDEIGCVAVVCLCVRVLWRGVSSYRSALFIIAFDTVGLLTACRMPKVNVPCVAQLFTPPTIVCVCVCVCVRVCMCV